MLFQHASTRLYSTANCPSSQLQTVTIKLNSCKEFRLMQRAVDVVLHIQKVEQVIWYSVRLLLRERNRISDYS